MQKRLLCFSTVAGLCVLAANVHAQPYNLSASGGVVGISLFESGTGPNIIFESYAGSSSYDFGGNGSYNTYVATTSYYSMSGLQVYSVADSAAYSPAGFAYADSSVDLGKDSTIRLVNTGSAPEEVSLGFHVYNAVYSFAYQTPYAIGKAFSEFGFENTVANSGDGISYFLASVLSQNDQFSSGGSFVQTTWEENINHVATGGTLGQNGYYLSDLLNFTIAPTDNFVFFVHSSNSSRARIAPSPAALAPFGMGLIGAFLRRRKRS